MGGSHHCSEHTLLLFLQDRFSLVEGFSECTTPSGLTFEFHSYVRHVLKRFFIKMQAWSCTLPGTKHISILFSTMFPLGHISTLSERERCHVMVPLQYLQETSTDPEDREDQDCPGLSPGLPTI